MSSYNIRNNFSKIAITAFSRTFVPTVVAAPTSTSLAVRTPYNVTIYTVKRVDDGFRRHKPKPYYYYYVCVPYYYYYYYYFVSVVDPSASGSGSAVFSASTVHMCCTHNRHCCCCSATTTTTEIRRLLPGTKCSV